MIELDKDGEIYVVTMNNGTNMICSGWQDRMLEILDVLENNPKAGSAMVLIGEGKFFSNGLNLNELSELDQDGLSIFGKKMHEIYRRLLSLPYPTVAAINGHAFAGGAFVAMCCDYRIMREDRGWFCFSEVDAGVPLHEPEMKIIRGKVPANSGRDAILSGKRYTADEAVSSGFADAKADLKNLLGDAKELVASLACKDADIFRTLKQAYFSPIVKGFE